MLECQNCKERVMIEGFCSEECSKAYEDRGFVGADPYV